MKKLKILGITFAFASCLLLAGCGSEKVLTCSTNQKQAGLSMDQTVEVTFNGDKVSNLKLIVASEATNDTIKNNWDLFTDSLAEQFPDSNKEGIELTKDNNESDHIYTITIDVDVAKAKDDDLADYNLDGLADAEGTYDSVKEQDEISCFTCE